MRGTQRQPDVSHGRAGELRTVGSLETPGKQQNTGHRGSKPLQGACPLPVLSVPGLGPNRSLAQAALQTLCCKGSACTRVCLECASTACDCFPCWVRACANRFRHPHTMSICTPCAYRHCSKLGGTHAAHLQCCQSLGWYSFSRKGCSPGQLDASCVCTGHFTIVGVRGATGLPAAGKLSAHPSAPLRLGKVWAAVMSSVPHLALLHPTPQLHSRDAVMAFRALFARALCPPHGPGMPRSSRVPSCRGDRQ